jgi:hypothetical protein
MVALRIPNTGRRARTMSTHFITQWETSAMTTHLRWLLLSSLVALPAGQRSAGADDRADPQPERILFSPVEDGRPGRCHILFTPDGRYLLTDRVVGGPTVVSTADWLPRPLMAVDTEGRHLGLLTACFPCTAIVVDADNNRLLAIDPSAPNRQAADLGGYEGLLHRWAAARRTHFLAITERIDRQDGQSLRLSLINLTTGAREVLQEIDIVRSIYQRLHFFDFMDSDRYLVWATGDAVGVWDLNRRSQVAEADLTGAPCRIDHTHRRTLGLSGAAASPTFWICARQNGLFEGRLEDGRIKLESVPARALVANQQEKRPTFRAPHGSLGAHGSSVPSLRYHRACPWNDDRWLVAKTHYYAVFGPSDFSVKVIDVASGRSLISLPSRRSFEPPGNSIAASDAAGLMAIQAPDGTVVVWRREEVERYVNAQRPTSISRIFAAVKAGLTKTLVDEAAAGKPPRSPTSGDAQR